MRKTLLPTVLAIALAAALMAAPSAAHADIADYNADDIEAIEGIIFGLILGWPEATRATETVDDTWMAANWPGVTWSTGPSDRRVVELDVSGYVTDVIQNPYLDFSGLTALKVLDVSDNNLIKQIDLSGCAALEYLNCSNNSLPGLDLTGNPALTYLDCSVNNIGDSNTGIFIFNISANSALEYLYCDDNQLFSLDISHLVNLIEFSGSLQRGFPDFYHTGSGPYSKTSALNENTVFDNPAVSYSEGVLTSTDSSVSSVNFSSVLDSDSGWVLSGTLHLRYFLLYNVTFDAAGGTVDPTSAFVDRSFQLSSLPVPIRSGYEFAGWFTAPSGGTLVTLDDYYEGDTTIYARWIPIEAPAPQPTTPPTGDVAGLMAASTSLLAAVGAGGALTIRRRRRTI